jgi:PAS domain S-box-containing protein
MRGGRIEAVDTTRVPGMNVYGLAEDADGAVWVATGRGLTRIAADGTRTFGTADGLPSEHVAAVAPAKAGGVWASTSTGLVRLDGGRVVERYGPENGLGALPRHIAEDAEGTLWLGSNGGLWRLSGGRAAAVPESLVPAGPVEALLTDREGHLWMGISGSGLNRLSDAPITPFGAPEGLPVDGVFPVLQDRAGDLWAGDGDAGLVRIGADGLHRVDGQFVFSLAQDADGAVWAGTPAGLTRIQDGKATRFGAADGIPMPGPVRAVLADRRGRLWLGTPAGVVRFRPGPPVTIGPAQGLARGFVTTLFEDRDGAVWAGTRRGVTRITDAGVRTWTRADGMPDGEVTGLVRASDGNLWMSTAAGLARMDARGRVTAFAAADGLCDDELHAIVEDGAGRLWLSANRGVFALRLANLDAPGARRVSCTLYGRAEGMRTRETNGAVNPAGLRLRDGRIVFPTQAGLAFIDPDRLTRPLPAPPVAIEEMLADGRALRTDGVLPAGTRELEIHFTALSFQAPEKVRFRYRLQGLGGGEWTDAGTRRTAFFTRLGPGSYRLEVQARHPGGPWSAAGAALGFRVPPRLHETWWFRALAFLAVLAALWTAYRLRVRALRARERELVALVEERTRAESRYRDLFDNATDAVLTTDRDGRITALNRRARELTGYGDDGVGIDLRALLGAEDGEAWLAGTGDATRLVEVVARDGTRIPVEVSTRVIEEDGRPVGTQAVARDVRERIALERQLRQAQKMEAVGQLAGGVAHDFNNLLTIIRGASELVVSDLPANDPSREDLSMVISASDRAAGLTRQLLAFSRKQVAQPERVDLNALVTGIEPMLRRLIGEDIRVTSSTCGEPAWVMADPGQLEQVLVNLAVNARDAMPNGGSLTLRTSVLPDCDRGDAPLGTPGGPCVVLSVTDSGVGMDAKTQARIFEPFFTTKDVGRGTGLGLSTVYGIVQQAGGTIQCSSRPGHGTTFRVRLPFAGTMTLGATPAPSAEAEGGRGGMPPRTVLLVEDEVPVRAMAARILRRHGHHVLETGSGEEALVAARRHGGPIDLLLTDVVMPQMSGRVLAERLTPVHPEMRVLYMSGYTDDEILRRGLYQPGVRYLQKPFTVDGLAEAVASLLDEPAPEPVRLGDAATLAGSFGAWAMDA